MSESVPRNEALSLDVPANLAGERVDKAVALLAGVSRRVAAELLAKGSVKVDGRLVDARSRLLTSGERLEIDIPESDASGPVPDAEVEFKVVHEDSQIVVVDKPAGLVVHAGAGHHTGTLVSGLLARYPELEDLPRQGAGETDRPGIVHRLDKGTSGLLVVARTADAFESLSRQFREHTAGREYRALVAGLVESQAGTIEAPIARSARRPDRMAISAGGRAATTNYSVAARYGSPVPLTLIDAVLGTGRTHQVRVHLAAIGHPVIGDDRYGAPASRPKELRGQLESGRLFLHARRLELEHPSGGRALYESPLPPDLAGVLEGLDPL